MLDSHPADRPLGPASVDDAFSRAAAFFPRYFADRPATNFWCESWLLDPDLAAALPAASNMSRFQQRWTLTDEVQPADGDALFFTFARRKAVDHATLPRDTTLQRAIIDRWEAGEHWHLRSGTVPMGRWAP